MHIRFRFAVFTVLLTSACVLAPSAAATWADRLKGAVPLPPEPVAEDPAATTLPVGVEHDSLAAGLKEALTIGARSAVESAGKTDGFLGNPAIRIPMPGFLGDAGAMLRGAGLGRHVDAFEKSMNRAAEKAAPQAAGILVEAIQDMTIDDARTILVGSPDGATRFLRRRAGERIADEFRPIIAAAIQEQGVTASFSELSDQVRRIPALGSMEGIDLTEHVTTRAIDGLFVLIGEEERKIRQDPAARTTDLLRQVFGG